MRIIAGRLKRRKLLSNPGMVTRPLTDRVKVSLFQFLESDLQDARVADVFSGTGTLGLEALSRGARSVVFYERDRTGFELLRQNVQSLGVGDETLCWNVDVARTSFRPKNCDHMLPYDVIFFDPPYRMVKDIVPGSPLYRSLVRLAREDVSSPNALMLFRTPKHSTFELPDVWQIEHVSEYSSMTVHWFRRAEGVSAEAEEASTGESDDSHVEESDGAVPDGEAAEENPNPDEGA